MRGEDASSVRTLVAWLERRECGEITEQNYEMLAEMADRWDIPMLHRDIEVNPLLRH
jgi:hypothetical protein